MIDDEIIYNDLDDNLTKFSPAIAGVIREVGTCPFCHRQLIVADYKDSDANLICYSYGSFTCPVGFSVNIDPVSYMDNEVTFSLVKEGYANHLFNIIKFSLFINNSHYIVLHYLNNKMHIFVSGKEILCCPIPEFSFWNEEYIKNKLSVLITFS